MPAENAGRAFSLVLADELARQGVRHAVVAPGSRSTPIALALLEHPQIAVHVRIDERSAAHLALGIAKASRTIVPVLCTSGTAASYFHGAVLEADLAGVPLLVVTADRPPELHGIGANQTIGQAGLYGSAVRWAPNIPTPEAGPDSVGAWRAGIAEAAARCLGSDITAPGPVHLNIPLREPLIPIDDGIGFPYPLGLDEAPAATMATATAPRPDAPEALIGQLRSVRRGVIVAGGWAGDEADEVVRIAARCNWPLIAEPHSNARRGRNALRAADALLRDESFVTAHQPDLVVVIGRIGLSRPVLEWLATVTHVVISPDGGNWDVTKTAAAVHHCSVAAFGATAAQVTPAETSWLAGWVDAAQATAARFDAAIDAAAVLSEPQVARDVAAMIPDGATLVVSSSMPIRDLDLLMHPRDTITVLANRGVSGIDGFVSTAQGVALAINASAGPTVALCGDLSFLHDINGLMPGPDNRPDVTYVVINNDGGGIFSLLPQGKSVDPTAFERLFGTPHGMSLEQVAAAYQVPHTLVTTTAELQAAISQPAGLRLVEVRTNRTDNAELHARLRAIAPQQPARRV
jgi:2-succinyl-5-enolpyruvyl-6-hydroxy-3-cyclohexene-1-carboxylate synthase